MDSACDDFVLTRQKRGVLSLELEDRPFIGAIECEVSARDRNQFYLWLPPSASLDTDQLYAMTARVVIGNDRRDAWGLDTPPLRRVGRAWHFKLGANLVFETNDLMFTFQKFDDFQLIVKFFPMITTERVKLKLPLSYGIKMSFQSQYFIFLETRNWNW